MFDSFINIPLMTVTCLLLAMTCLPLLERMTTSAAQPAVVECQKTRNGYLC